jgi:hypothetical protein
MAMLVTVLFLHFVAQSAPGMTMRRARSPARQDHRPIIATPTAAWRGAPPRSTGLLATAASISSKRLPIAGATYLERKD